MIRHLFVPGLLGPMPGLERDTQPALPRLEALLARADRLVEPVGYAEGLFALFDIDAPAGVDLPTAAIGFLADTGQAPTGYLLHADPVHLLPDQDRLLAFDLDDDPLDDVETAGLVEAFNNHFVADGVRLEASSAGRLYLHCEREPAIRTHPLSTVLGRNLDLFLPEGEDRRWWRGLLNEAQMLCHTLHSNGEREAKGRPRLDGLWFSGGGTLPPAGLGPAGRVVGDCVLARGLQALRSGVRGEMELVVEHAPFRAVVRADTDAWLGALVELEDRIFGLQQACEALYVHPGNGTVYRWHARSGWRLWRRKRPLVARLDRNPEVPRGSLQR